MRIFKTAVLASVFWASAFTPAWSENAARTETPATTATPAGTATLAGTETPEEWIQLARRVHGGFGTYLPLGIRIGLDAKAQLGAGRRELDVTYYDSPGSPCACVADGLMLATGATLGQNSLRVAPTKSARGTFGVAVIRNKRTGRTLRYTIPASARASLDWWNKNRDERGRYDEVMNAPQAKMFQRHVVAAAPKAAPADAPAHTTASSNSASPATGSHAAPSHATSPVATTASSHQ